MYSIKLSMKLFVPSSPLDDKRVLVQVMAWCGINDKLLRKPMLTKMASQSRSVLINQRHIFGQFVLWCTKCVFFNHFTTSWSISVFKFSAQTPLQNASIWHLRFKWNVITHSGLISTPAGTWHNNNVFITSKRRRRRRLDVMKMLSLRHYCVMCPLGRRWNLGHEWVIISHCFTWM